MSNVPSEVDNANAVLEILISKADEQWEETLSYALTEKELERSVATLERKLEEFDLETPVGAIEGGTGPIREESGLEGENFQKAIQELKSQGRLQQCGPGRGKALIVLDNTRLKNAPSMEAVLVGDDEPEQDAVDVEDVVALTRALREAFRKMSQTIHKLERENAALSEENQELHRRLEQMETVAN